MALFFNEELRIVGHVYPLLFCEFEYNNQAMNNLMREGLINLKKKKSKSIDIISLLLGLSAGIVTELLNLLPNNDLFGFSSIAGSFGFWIFSTTLVIYFSRSNINAFFNTVFYLGGMCISYYLLQGIFDYITPNKTVEHFLQWSHLFFWLGATLLCGVIAFILYFWNGTNKYLNSFLCALPVAGMLSDTINNTLKFMYSGTQLFQLILDVVFLVVLLALLFKKSRNKLIFILVVLLVAMIGQLTGVINSNTITMQTYLHCEVNGEVEEFYIKIRDDGVILEKEGNEEIYNIVGIENYKTVPEIVHAFQDYYESIGGTCSTVD